MKQWNYLVVFWGYLEYNKHDREKDIWREWSRWSCINSIWSHCRTKFSYDLVTSDKLPSPCLYQPSMLEISGEIRWLGPSCKKHRDDEWSFRYEIKTTCLLEKDCMFHKRHSTRCMGNNPFVLEWECAFKFVMRSWKRFESFILVNLLFLIQV